MKRKIIEIDEGKCDGCGICTESCKEAALAIVDGKARLVRDVYCDGLGNCIPACPCDAISFVEREAEEFNLTAGRLNQWPIQLKLVQAASQFFDDADVLVSADCAAYSYGAFHNDFMRKKITVIGCPKLDNIDYSEKLSEIFIGHNIKSITLARMLVPCCGGLQRMTEAAIEKSAKKIPLNVITLSPAGAIVEGVL